MATATLCIIAGVSTAIFFRKKNIWLKIHKIFNLVGFGGITSGIAMASIYVWGTGGEHIDGVHQITGLAVFISSLITMLAGFYQFKAKNKPAFRTTHRWFGRLSLFLLLGAIILGLARINII